VKTTQTLVEKLPETLQGLVNFRRYAVNQIKKNLIINKRLEKQIVECDKRIEAKEKGE